MKFSLYTRYFLGFFILFSDPLLAQQPCLESKDMEIAVQEYNKKKQQEGKETFFSTVCSDPDQLQVEALSQMEDLVHLSIDCDEEKIFFTSDKKNIPLFRGPNVPDRHPYMKIFPIKSKVNECKIFSYGEDKVICSYIETPEDDEYTDLYSDLKYTLDYFYKEGRLLMRIRSGLPRKELLYPHTDFHLREDYYETSFAKELEQTYEVQKNQYDLVFYEVPYGSFDPEKYLHVKGSVMGVAIVGRFYLGDQISIPVKDKNQSIVITRNQKVYLVRR
ncbi:MAG: hypothetical protein R3A11_08315 [Bdellovibrionota bacterium]